MHGEIRLSWAEDFPHGLNSPGPVRKEHYTATKNKLIEGLASLRKLQNILPQSKLENVYKALFESQLRYGSVIWDSLSPTKLEHLQCLQTRAISIIQSAKYKDAWTPQSWLSLRDILFFDKAVLTYKIIHGLCPDKLKNKFTQRSMVSAYRTRNYLDLQIPRARLEYTKRDYSAAKVWNEIPVSIRANISLTYFKQGLKTYLLLNPQ